MYAGLEEDADIHSEGFQDIMNDGGAIRIKAGDSVYTAPGNKIPNNSSIIDSNGYGGNGIISPTRPGSWTSKTTWCQFQSSNSNLYWRTAASPATQRRSLSKRNRTAPAKAVPHVRAMAAERRGRAERRAESGFANLPYPADDYSLPKGSPGVGFVPFDPNQAVRTNPIINPPPVPATFPTKLFNPAIDY